MCCICDEFNKMNLKIEGLEQYEIKTDYHNNGQWLTIKLKALAKIKQPETEISEKTKKEIIEDESY